MNNNIYNKSNNIFDKNYCNMLEIIKKTKINNGIFIFKYKYKNEYIKNNTDMCNIILDEFINKYNYKNNIELKKYYKSIYCSIVFNII